MTRRLAIALVAFTAAVLLASVLPLGLSTAARDKRDYRNSTAQLAHSLATLAEEAFDERSGPLTPTRLASAASSDAGVVIVDRFGNTVITAGTRFAVPSEVVHRALAGDTLDSWTSGADPDPLTAVPVTVDGSIAGAVVVMRSYEPLEHRLVRLWLGLGALSLAALVVALLLAVAVARWVGRPLQRLKRTALGWADGRLDERAALTGGPPELRDLAETFNAMAGRLEALLLGSRAVVADVSHQLRTPLAAMRLRLELMRSELDGRGEEDLAAALAEIDRLSRLVDGLLAVSRAEYADIAPEPVDVVRLAEERRQAWQPVADERGVTIIVDTSGPTPGMAATTPGHLDQVLDNLLDNALDVVSPGGHVTMAVADDESGRVVVRVADDGPGMSPQQRERAFHRFVTGDTERGTGLGLAIVHRLVTADGGNVRIEETPGGGTTVVLDLPAARPAVPAR